MRLIDSSVVRRFKRRRELQTNYQDYVKAVTPNYVDGWMVKDLCARLQKFSEAVRRRESPRLAISMPPRSGKTIHGVERLTPWHLGHSPADKVIVASYGMALARQMTRESRSIVRGAVTGKVFPDLHLSRDSAEKADWLTTVNGGACAAGTGTPITGRGCEILIVDDPFKDHREALSPRVREDRLHWYGTAARSRVSAGGGVLLIGTRWHQADMIARVLEDYEHEVWEEVNYPAIAEEDHVDPVTGAVLRRVGEALHPERWNLEALDKIRLGLPKTWWLALYQGKPTDPEGKVWSRHQWRRWIDTPPTQGQIDTGVRQRPKSFERIFISADLTMGSQTEVASYNVIQTWGYAGGALWLLKEARGKWTNPVQRAQLVAAYRAYPGAKVYVENKAGGVSILNELKRVIPGIEGIKPVGDKTQRAMAASPLVVEARVFIPAEAEVDGAPERKGEAGEIDTEAWLTEVCDFPNAPNDDRVDAVSQLISKVLVTDAPGRVFFSSRGRG